MLYQFHPSILREYDIRGIVGQTLHEADAYAIGRAFGSMACAQRNVPVVAVGRDGREESPALEAALVKGLMECGAQVKCIGIGPTPMLYFAARTLPADAAVMITGSHNPRGHNGFKFMHGTKAIYGDDIKNIGRIAAAGTYAQGEGAQTQVEVTQRYIKSLLDGVKKNGRKLKIAWDAGNGAAGEIMQALVKQLPGEHIMLNETIDGTFPNHHPDPSVAENLQQLIATVREHSCDCGLAFDGDADRLGVVDDEGNIVWGDQIMVVLAREVLAHTPGATVIADVKASNVLFDEVAKAGGKPVMWKTGHSLVKARMAELGAAFAGEMSGHIFYADHWGFDDGLYAAVRFLNALAQHTQPLSATLAQLPTSFSTPELRIYCDDARKFAVVEEVKTRLKESGADMFDLDGIRVSTPNGWWLLRASNTQAALSARCEGNSPAALNALKAELATQLQASGITL